MCNREYEFPEDVYEKSAKSVDKTNETRSARMNLSDNISLGEPKEINSSQPTRRCRKKAQFDPNKSRTVKRDKFGRFISKLIL